MRLYKFLKDIDMGYIGYTVILLLAILLVSAFIKKAVEGMEPMKGTDRIKPSKSSAAIVSMIKKPKNIETWLKKHRNLGISKFYIRLEDTPELEDYLRSQPDVYVLSAKSKGVDEYNNIQVRQDEWVNSAIKLARDDGIPWILHIDSDEILDGDLQVIYKLPDTVDTFWMQNIEAVYKDVPSEKDNCFDAVKFNDCGKPPYNCIAYVNGKSGGRTTVNVSANGPHRFKSSRTKTDAKIEEIVVKHYESCDFNSYKEKYKRLKGSKLDSIPFPYYKDSIKAANKGDDDALECVYSKYRTEKGGSLECDNLLGP